MIPSILWCLPCKHVAVPCKLRLHGRLSCMFLISSFWCLLSLLFQQRCASVWQWCSPSNNSPIIKPFIQYVYHILAHVSASWLGHRCHNGRDIEVVVFASPVVQKSAIQPVLCLCSLMNHCSKITTLDQNNSTKCISSGCMTTILVIITPAVRRIARPGAVAFRRVPCWIIVCFAKPLVWLCVY